MEAKSNAELINDVVAGEVIICKKCGAQNEADSMFCYACGSPIEAEPPKKDEDVVSKSETDSPSSDSETPAFKQVKEDKTEPGEGVRENVISSEAETGQPEQAQAFEKSEEVEEASSIYTEPASVFADGLPGWDIVPPGNTVRRGR